MSAPGLLLSASGGDRVAQKLSTIEFERQQAGISRVRLAAAAAVDERWLRRVLQDPRRATVSFCNRLESGLRRLRSIPPGGLQAVTIAYAAFLVAIAPHYGVTPSEVRAADPQRGATADRHWQRCAHARQAAIYLTNTALGLPQRQLAAALGLTPAAVCLGCKAVEDRRSDPAFEAAMVAAQRDVTGVCDG